MILATGSMALPGNPLPGSARKIFSSREQEGGRASRYAFRGRAPERGAKICPQRSPSAYFSFLTHSGSLIGPSEMEAGNTMNLLPSSVHCATPATAVLVGSSP